LDVTDLFGSEPIMMQPYRELYRKNLFESETPFWLKHSLDREFGGTFSCLDRNGTVYDTKKYVWLMGRSVWMFSRMYNECGRNLEYLEAARLGVEFIEKYAADEKGRYYFSLTRQGQPYFFQRKPYSAVFAMLGYLEYARAVGRDHYRHKAVDLFWQITRWIEEPCLLDRPILAGTPPISGLANVMVLASMAIELAHVDDDPRYLDIMAKAIQGCQKHFDAERRVFVENVSLDGRDLRDWPEGRLFSPGHSIEVAWFLLNLLEFSPDPQAEQMAYDALEGSLQLGWDDTYDGLYYFMDLANRPTLQLESSMKLWWPHTEALYALILAYVRTKNKLWFDWFEKVHQYTFGHFVDNQFGGWFGYCDRQGNLTHTCKGGNYKGFFHVPRALLFIVQRLEQFSTPTEESA
jgi:N-acylglucosamine 2-epimerase